MKTVMTFFRPMTHDAGYLESTWFHVPEDEGVQLQFEAEFNEVEARMRDNHDTDISLKILEKRRVVTGKFHPGRQVLPNRAVEYQLVYNIHTASDIDEEEFVELLADSFRFMNNRPAWRRGNVTEFSKSSEPEGRIKISNVTITATNTSDLPF